MWGMLGEVYARVNISVNSLVMVQNHTKHFDLQPLLQLYLILVSQTKFPPLLWHMAWQESLPAKRQVPERHHSYTKSSDSKLANRRILSPFSNLAFPSLEKNSKIWCFQRLQKSEKWYFPRLTQKKAEDSWTFHPRFRTGLMSKVKGIYIYTYICIYIQK